MKSVVINREQTAAMLGVDFDKAFLRSGRRGRHAKNLELSFQASDSILRCKKERERVSDSPAMISTLRLCPKCGAEMPSDAPGLGCPRCLLESALNEHATKSESVVAIVGELGDYELLEVVGRGGQGVVFRARQKSLNRTVALKMINVGSWATEAHLKRFRREAEAAASLEHPGIVPIYEVGERDGSCYFSMRFVEGGQLDQAIKRKPTSIRQAAELISKVARTVHYAHEHGILHRDIKPGNILLDAKGEPLLTDFGLARLVEAESTVTRTKEVMGTPSYMAPEQAMGNNAAVSSATDVYGLGAILYQLLTGHPPFAGGTTYETIKLVLDTEPRQPRLLNPKVDRDLSTICLKCLEKDPKRRYPSALALAEDLEHWLKHEPILARRTGLFTRGRKWVRRNPSTAVLVTLLVAFAAGLTLVVWNRESTEPGKALSTAAQIAVALASFACVVIVFRRESVHEWSGLDKLRLQLLLANSILPLGLCMMGLLLLTIKPMPPGIWRWCSGITLVATLLFVTGISKIFRRLDLQNLQRERVARLIFYLFVALGLAAMFLQVYNVALPGVFWPFFAGIVFQLVTAMAQFARMILLRPE
jgi:hypothetical protein